MKLKDWRVAEGLSIRQAAKLFEISHQHLINLENGKAKPSRIDFAMRVKKLTKNRVTLHDLYQGAA